MRSAAPIARRDIVGDVTFQFCESDWELITELVLDFGIHPPSRCNAVCADLSIRRDFETLLDSTYDESDQTEQGDRLLAEVRIVTSDADGPMVEEHSLVKAHATVRMMAKLGVDRPT